MTIPTLVRWDDLHVESEIPNEAEKTEELKTIIHSLQVKNFKKHRHAFRATHVKTQAVVKGTFVISPGLPPHLAQGLFADGDIQHSIALRYANEPSFLQDDKSNAPYGIGMKVFNVEARKAGWLEAGGDSTTTQDFTFNNSPVVRAYRSCECGRHLLDSRTQFRQPG